MCDTLVRLTDDGVLFAKNSDRDANEPQLLRWYAAAAHPAGATVDCTWSTIPQVTSTHAVVLSQPWWMWGAEMGANEHGVVIGNEAVFTRRTGAAGAPGSAGELLGMDLVRLGLERAVSRADAVEVIVTLLERHGQGGSCSHEHPRFSYDNSYIVADPDGATVLETAGRQWATEEVAGSRSISNGLTITGFAERHADLLRGRVAACAVRRDLTTRSASVAGTPVDLMRALRDHGGPAPAWHPVNGALSAPCAHAGGLITSTQTTASWVADLRIGSPQGGRHWATGTSAPCTSLFKPVTVHEPASPDPSAPPDNRADPAYLWWRHEQLHRLALRDLTTAVTVIGPERDELERAWLADPPPADKAFALGDEAEQRWLQALQSAGLTETRPRWVRALWRRWDRQAGLTPELQGAVVA